MSQTISGSEIKFIRSLEQKKFRDRHGMFVVEGDKMVAEALESRFEVVRLYRSDDIGKAMMERISLLASPSPALALLRKDPGTVIPDATAFKVPERGLFLALDGIRDPGNLGTIIRISDWFGIDGIFASADTVDLFNPKTVQATMGAIFRVNFHYTDLPVLCRRFSESGGRVHGTFLDGDPIYSRTICTGEDSPSLIVIGNESRGICDEVAATVTDRLLIPSFPPSSSGSESLNAAVATAITVAEFRRRLINKKYEE